MTSTETDRDPVFAHVDQLKDALQFAMNHGAFICPLTGRDKPSGHDRHCLACRVRGMLEADRYLVDEQEAKLRLVRHAETAGALSVLNLQAGDIVLFKADNMTAESAKRLSDGFNGIFEGRDVKAVVITGDVSLSGVLRFHKDAG